MNIEFEDWGIIDYALALEKQRSLFNEALDCKTNNREVSNKCILCEHNPVFTLGKHGDSTNLLVDNQILHSRGVEVFRVERGGDITFHGPGQVVCYPIIDLNYFHLSLKEYIHLLEEVVIQLIADYGIIGMRVAGAPGVWLDNGLNNERKIAALGVKSSRYITMHGIALNVNTDLNYFKLINPCGFTQKGVTSIQKELDLNIPICEVKDKMQKLFLTLLQ